ncbi:hypothetical protein [Chromobacterium alticapitis]|uniref:Uncharacterized protein n=1 Tax=Chromobacterium alticapitis TaxID=2073169 RepID=A0A2S5DL03_9NEIS|nr:hypothetical protein [Chromobacterium alticapitis]POZ63770.1 hypothetical protein C2I19_01580 [Chromobacterium alticapitis]
MSIALIDAEARGAAALTRREPQDGEAGRQWQRQLEAELASHSVCKAIRMGQEETVRFVRDGAEASSNRVLAERDVAAPWVRSGGALAADPSSVGAAARPLLQESAAAKAAAGEAPAWAVKVSASLESGVEEAAAPSRGPVEEAEAALRTWLKPSKITVFSDQGELRVWVRDAKLAAGEIEALGQRLARHVREKGGRLALLAVNGAVVFQGEAASGLHISKQG